MPSFVVACNDVAAASVATAVEGCVLLSKCAGRSFTGVLPLRVGGGGGDDDVREAYSIRGAQSHHVHVQMVGVRTAPLERMASTAGALPLVAAMGGETEGATEEAAAAEYEVNERLKGMEDEERSEYIHTFIRDAVTDAIGSDSPVEPDAELMEAGLDSLAFVDLRNKIVEEVSDVRESSVGMYSVVVWLRAEQTALSPVFRTRDLDVLTSGGGCVCMQMGVDLEVTIFFDYRTTAALSARVDELVGQACRGETELTGFAFMRTVRPDRTAIPLFLGAPAFGDGPLVRASVVSFVARHVPSPRVLRVKKVPLCLK
jgi:hypothetical protein